MSERQLLEVSNLSISAGERALVSDLSFSMAAGERIGLIGESGSGKSLTATALLGLLPEELSVSGTGRLHGFEHNLFTAPERAMAPLRGDEISMVFQEPLSALNPLMKIGAQVAEVLLIHRTLGTRAAARARAIELLASVQIPDPAQAANAYPHQLSGGQRQRVMIAMALANDPQLLLCDEPTTALDVTAQSDVMAILEEQRRSRGMSLLLITHDLELAAACCDELAVMYAGQIVEQGAGIHENPRHPYTTQLLEARPSIESKSDRLPTLSYTREDHEAWKSTRFDAQEVSA